MSASSDRCMTKIIVSVVVCVLAKILHHFLWPMVAYRAEVITIQQMQNTDASFYAVSWWGDSVNLLNTFFWLMPLIIVALIWRKYLGSFFK